MAQADDIRCINVPEARARNPQVMNTQVRSGSWDVMASATQRFDAANLINPARPRRHWPLHAAQNTKFDVGGDLVVARRRVAGVTGGPSPPPDTAGARDRRLTRLAPEPAA
jgi:hypothetical protein